MSIWRPSDSEIVSRCLFQYAVSSKSTCEGCKKIIPAKSLRAKVENGANFYHFECFWKYETTAKCKKDEIMVTIEKMNPAMYSGGLPSYVKIMKDKCQYVSLETLDKVPITCLISQEDVEQIRHFAALAEEGKTLYYTPDFIKKQFHTCACCNVQENGLEPDEDYHSHGLRYDKAFYHSNCLAESGILNIDAKEIRGYEALDVAEKESLDELFVKDDDAGPIFMVVKKLGHEHCSLKDCSYKVPIVKSKRKSTTFQPQRAIKSGELRVRYEHLSYHPKCFASLSKFNINGSDIRNYDMMNEEDQMVLDECFVEKDDFDIPLIEKVDELGYCAECCASKSPSKFPYPLTIGIKPKKDRELQIRFQGEIFHPICFQASGKVNMTANEMLNYGSLDDEEKQIINEIFKKTQKRKSTDDRSNVAIKKRKSMEGNEEIDDDIKVEIKQETSCFSIPEYADNVGGSQSAETLESEENEQNAMVAPTVDFAVKQETEVSEVIHFSIVDLWTDFSANRAEHPREEADVTYSSQEVIANV